MMIVNLFAPLGPSVNDNIEPSLCSMQECISGRHCMKGARLWAGALMAKLDLKAAYHMAPVHSADKQLLGIH